MSIEIGVKDSHILYEFKNLVTCNSFIRERTRDTNFKSNHTSISWTVHDWGFRNAINEAGVPYGKKSFTIQPPKQEYVQSDYWRGIIDADGSLGITAQGFPFCSLVTSSEPLAEAYFDLIEQLTDFRPTTKKNKRDGVYNIMVWKERAKILVKFLYENASIALDRKRTSASEIMNWQRQPKMPRSQMKRWTDEEKEFVMTHSVAESMRFLQRPLGSIYGIRNYLKRKGD